MNNKQQQKFHRTEKQKRVVADDAKARSKLLLMFLAVGKIYLYIYYT